MGILSKLWSRIVKKTNQKQQMSYEYTAKVIYLTNSCSLISFFKPGTDILHRLDGPAVEWFNGYKEWRQNGLLHRLDGPAVEGINGPNEWYIEGKQYTEEEFIAATQKHTVTIDGKTVEISAESYEKIKKELV